MAEVMYVVDKDVTDRDEAATVCTAVLDVVADRLVGAIVDAYSDYDDVMTPLAREAQRRLLALATEQGRSHLGVEVALENPDAWAMLRAFAPWSINVDLLDAHGNHVATFHDCGYSVVAELCKDDAAALAARLSPIAPVIPLSVVHARRRAERQASRGRRLRRTWSRLFGGG